MEFAGGDLLEGRGVETEVHTPHDRGHAAGIPDIPNVELQLRIPVLLAHVILLLLVPAEDADFLEVRGEEAPQNSISKGAGAAGDEKDFIGEHMHPGELIVECRWFAAS
jgi:hypothetical protein